jgi:hypothetical protein
MADEIEAQVSADIAAMVSGHPMGEALTAVALMLARRLDMCVDDRSAPPLAKELRATLAELASMRDGDDDDLDAALSTPVLSTKVRDPEDP